MRFTCAVGNRAAGNALQCAYHSRPLCPIMDESRRRCDPQLGHALYLAKKGPGDRLHTQTERTIYLPMGAGDLSHTQTHISQTHTNTRTHSRSQAHIYKHMCKRTLLFLELVRYDTILSNLEIFADCSGGCGTFSK